VRAPRAEPVAPWLWSRCWGRLGSQANVLLAGITDSARDGPDLVAAVDTGDVRLIVAAGQTAMVVS